jgi:hypothetical protein
MATSAYQPRLPLRGRNDLGTQEGRCGAIRGHDQETIDRLPHDHSLRRY